MISRRLLREIERNANKLAVDLVRTVRQDRRAESYKNLSDEQFEGVVLDLYSNLGQWLHTRSWAKLQAIYEKKGRERCHGAIPLQELIFSLTMTKKLLLDFIRGALPGEAAERDMELELILSVSDFFDKALYHTIRGYEDAQRASFDRSERPPREPVRARPGKRKAVRSAENSVTDDADLAVSRGGDVGEVSG